LAPATDLQRHHPCAPSGWSTAHRVPTKAAWRCSTAGSGGLCVPAAPATLRPPLQWFAGSLALWVDWLLLRHLTHLAPYLLGRTPSASALALKHPATCMTAQALRLIPTTPPAPALQSPAPAPQVGVVLVACNARLAHDAIVLAGSSAGLERPFLLGMRHLCRSVAAGHCAPTSFSHAV